MSEADRMFEEINFIKIIDNNDFVEYENTNTTEKLIFNKLTESLDIRDFKVFTPKRMQAINKKVEELGWI